nr:hypothetical protein [Candidatus Sigynarchaeota archaeon]
MPMHVVFTLYALQQATLRSISRSDIIQGLTSLGIMKASRASIIASCLYP